MLCKSDNPKENAPLGATGEALDQKTPRQMRITEMTHDTDKQQQLQDTITVHIPQDARAVMVYRLDDGRLMQKPVPRTASVLDVQKDLIKHLNEILPRTGWLEELRDYVDARLEARNIARKTGGLVLAGSVRAKDRRWQVVVDPRVCMNGGLA